MGCAESTAVSRPKRIPTARHDDQSLESLDRSDFTDMAKKRNNNSRTNTAKPRQLRKKRTQRRPSQEEQVLGELPQPGEFDPSQGQQEQRSHYSDNKISSCSGSLGPSSGAGESNPLHTREALPPRSKSIDSMDDPEPSLLSMTTDDNDARPFVQYSDNTSSGRSTQSRVSSQSNKSAVVPNITPYTSASSQEEQEPGQPPKPLEQRDCPVLPPPRHQQQRSRSGSGLQHKMTNNNLAIALGMKSNLRRDSSRSMSFSEKKSSSAEVDSNPLGSASDPFSPLVPQFPPRFTTM